MPGSDEPIWLERLILDAIQLDQLREHGGLPGIRDENAIESALARPRNRHQYDPSADLAELAAAYGWGLARNHGYADGNKRIAFIAIAVFVELNGLEFEAAESDVVETMLALAAGDLTEEALASWIRGHLAST